MNCSVGGGGGEGEGGHHGKVGGVVTPMSAWLVGG